MSQHDILGAVSDFMARRGWIPHVCPSCSRTFYDKSVGRLRIVCGRGRCDDGESDFRKLSKRKSPMTLQYLLHSMELQFKNAGHELARPLSVVSGYGKTDLVVAGVQMYDEVIHGEVSGKEGTYFVAQPSIRTQFIADVAKGEGISTSFINVCTEGTGMTLDDHLNRVDQWCSVLSVLGLHAGDFRLVLKMSEKDWGTGKFDGLDIFFQYGDLELGDASYATVPRARGGSVTISDIGFGLERLLWAINKFESYYDQLAPLSIQGSRAEIDACRTLSLMAMCGIRASNRGAGQQFRKFARILWDAGTREVPTLIAHFYGYWKQFSEPATSLGDAIGAVSLEIDRVLNAKVCELLSLPPPKGETTEAYFERLVYTCGISYQNLRKAAQTCRKQH